MSKPMYRSVLGLGPVTIEYDPAATVVNYVDHHPTTAARTLVGAVDEDEATELDL